MVCKKEACGCSCWTGCVSTCNAWNLQRMLPAALEKKELNPTWYGLKRISHSQPLRIVGFPQNHKCLSKSTYSTPISTRQILEIHKYRVGARCQLDCGEKLLPLGMQWMGRRGLKPPIDQDVHWNEKEEWGEKEGKMRERNNKRGWRNGKGMSPFSPAILTPSVSQSNCIYNRAHAW